MKWPSTFDDLCGIVSDLEDRIVVLEKKKARPPRRPKLPAITFNRDTGKWWGIDDAWVDNIHTRLGIDVERELDKASVWLKNHPERHPADCRRFLTNWMLKAQRYAR
jgi:hypothetical protein